MTEGYIAPKKIRKQSPVQIARAYKKQIAGLQRERERLYYKALKELRMLDTISASEYFFHDQVGYSSFEEGLRGNS